ncbi:MAG: hypothetical protein ACE5KZ_00185 [Candidatus Scalinduaceae bacterium]
MHVFKCVDAEKAIFVIKNCVGFTWKKKDDTDVVESKNNTSVTTKEENGMINLIDLIVCGLSRPSR